MTVQVWTAQIEIWTLSVLGWWWPWPKLCAVQPCTHWPQHQGLHPAAPQQPWRAQRHWEAVYRGWIFTNEYCTLIFEMWSTYLIFAVLRDISVFLDFSSVQPGWGVQGKILPSDRHDRCRAGAADRWPLPVWQACVPPADLRWDGPRLARWQRHLVRDADRKRREKSHRNYIFTGILLRACGAFEDCSLFSSSESFFKEDLCQTFFSKFTTVVLKSSSSSRHNDNKSFLVWVNEEDHLRVISMQKGGNMKEVFRRFCVGLQKVARR